MIYTPPPSLSPSSHSFSSAESVTPHAETLTFHKYFLTRETSGLSIPISSSRLRRSDGADTKDIVTDLLSTGMQRLKNEATEVVYGTPKMSPSFHQGFNVIPR